MNAPLWLVLLGFVLAIVIIIVITMFIPARSSRFRKIDPRPPEPQHRCRRPHWRPFRKLGERVQCTVCGDTWRWDYGTSYADYDTGRHWISEGEEVRAEQVRDEANRNRW